MDQVTTYTYNLDGSLASTGFTNETIATPDISHTYDPYYPRPLTMVDGNGTTTYSYVAPGTSGAGQLASVDGPFSTDTMSYTYDALGRVLTRMMNSTGTQVTYDALGRLSQLEFPIGAFDYTYLGHTGRRAGVTYPNGQATAYSYLDNEHDFRLQTIHHKNPSAATLSKFDYTYDTIGNILTWRQERAGSAAKIYTFTNDLVDQLTSAVLTDTNSTPTILKRQAWSYDVAGNRTVDQTDDAVFSTSHDAMNRLQSRAAGGPIVFEGSLDEPATVTIDGKPATVDGTNKFRGSANLTGATTTMTVRAKDASGNETTKQYEVDAAGATTSYTYDGNGNLTSDGTKTYIWNALNQLVEMKEGTTTIATLEYDGGGRRTEKVAVGLTHRYIYDAEDIIEERITGTSSDTIRYYHGVGIDEPLARNNSSDVVTYYIADHLGSIVQETSHAAAVLLHREYDPWGKLLQGEATSGHAFTGREWDSEIDSYFYRARYYSPTIGRWLSEDPGRMIDGPNMFAYVGQNPVLLVDPFGLEWSWRGAAQGFFTGLWEGALSGAIGGGLAAGVPGAVTLAGIGAGVGAVGQGIAGGLNGAAGEAGAMAGAVGGGIAGAGSNVADAVRGRAGAVAGGVAASGARGSGLAGAAGGALGGAIAGWVGARDPRTGAAIGAAAGAVGGVVTGALAGGGYAGAARGFVGGAISGAFGGSIQGAMNAANGGSQMCPVR
jgi:RHS repeat-associated protein